MQIYLHLCLSQYITRVTNIPFDINAAELQKGAAVFSHANTQKAVNGE